MFASSRTWPASAILLIALLLAGCGGGGGGSGGSEPPPPPPPPPPQEPPVFTTPTAVRVTGATPFSANCLAVPAGATAYVDAEVEPHLAIDPANPNHLVAAWQQDRLSDGGARGLATAVSIDGGTTWSRPQPSPFSQCAGGSFARVSDPWVAVSGSAVLQIGIAFTGAALTAGARSAVLVSRSGDGGSTWGPALPLVDDDGSRFFHDKESLTIDSTDPRYVYAVWDRLDTSDSGPTLLARSTDGGVTWSPAATIYDPGLARQTIGNVAVTTSDGVVHVFFTELGPSASNPAATEGSLAVIRSTDKGVTWSAPTRIAQLLAVGTRLPSQASVTVRAGEVLGAYAANPADGTLYAAWQDSRFTGGAHDAIVLARSTDGGSTWSAPVRVSADAAVPAFTPTLAVLQSGLVGVTYYDFRQAATATFRPTDLWLAVSRDGAAWRETRLAGDFDLLDAPNASGLFLGDYHGLSGTGSTFVALYARTNTGDTANRTDVFADRVNGNSIATSGTGLDGAAQKTAAPAWTSTAEQRVGQHLSAVRATHRAQWRALREMGPGPTPK
jgi:hypothetical protein